MFMQNASSPFRMIELRAARESFPPEMAVIFGGLKVVDLLAVTKQREI
jgi:hypothetical protein